MQGGSSLNNRAFSRNLSGLWFKPGWAFFCKSTPIALIGDIFHGFIHKKDPPGFETGLHGLRPNALQLSYEPPCTPHLTFLSDLPDIVPPRLSSSVHHFSACPCQARLKPSPRNPSLSQRSAPFPLLLTVVLAKPIPKLGVSFAPSSRSLACTTHGNLLFCLCGGNAYHAFPCRSKPHTK